MIDYLIDGVNIRDEYGIYVSESTGIIDIPEQKARASVDWAEYHGEVVDTSRQMFKSKSIALKCVCKCDSAAGLVTKSQQLRERLSAAGFRRLIVSLSDSVKLYYDVILDGSIQFTKKWRQGSAFAAEFTISLKEPEPMKMVLNFPPSMESSSPVAILNVTTSKSIMICWGDGQMSQDLYGNNIDISHDYGEFGDYIAVIHGDIDALTVNSTNMTTIWNRLL